jgi:hypothetical protein
MSNMFLRLLTYLTNTITYDCIECGFNGDKCICDPPEYDNGDLALCYGCNKDECICDPPEYDKDDLALCYGCNEYACICGDYDKDYATHIGQLGSKLWLYQNF